MVKIMHLLTTLETARLMMTQMTKRSSKVLAARSIRRNPLKVIIKSKEGITVRAKIITPVCSGMEVKEECCQIKRALKLKPPDII